MAPPRAPRRERRGARALAARASPRSPRWRSLLDWSPPGGSGRRSRRVPCTSLRPRPRDPAATILASGLCAAPGAARRAAEPPRTPSALAGDTRLLGVLRRAATAAATRCSACRPAPRLVAAGQRHRAGRDARRRATRRHHDSRRGRRARASRCAASRRRRPPPAAQRRRRAPRAIPRARRRAGFKGAVLRLNAELFQGIIAQARELARDGRQPSRARSSCATKAASSTMLGMKKGDRLRRPTASRSTAPDDVVGAVLRPLAAQPAGARRRLARRTAARVAAAQRRAPARR